MKRFFCALLVIGLIGLCLPVQSQAQPKFGFKFTGGLNMLDGGDLNAGAEGWFDFWDYFATAFFNTTDGKFSPAKLGLNFGGEFILMFNSNMGVGLGAGILCASKESVLEWSNIFSSGDFTHTVKASAIPIRLSFYYVLPAGSNMNVFFNAGLGYYLGKANYTWSMTSDGSTETNENDVSGSGLGFHGGLGLEFKLSPMFGIVAELAGRFASFGGFEGEYRNSTTESGTLYFFEGDLGAPQSFPLIGVYDTEPWGSYVSHVREAKVSYTGFSFVIGAFVRF